MGISSGKGPRVAVLMGGHSLEREVSLVSGQACSAALRGKDFQVIELDAGLDVVQRLSELRPDVVFNALHGRYGEDGYIQAILEAEKIKEAKKDLAFAKLNNCPTSPRKMRLVADQIRGEDISSALSILKFSPKEASRRL